MRLSEKKPERSAVIIILSILLLLGGLVIFVQPYHCGEEYYTFFEYSDSFQQ